MEIFNTQYSVFQKLKISILALILSQESFGSDLDFPNCSDSNTINLSQTVNCGDTLRPLDSFGVRLFATWQSDDLLLLKDTKIVTSMTNGIEGSAEETVYRSWEAGQVFFEMSVPGNFGGRYKIQSILLAKMNNNYCILSKSEKKQVLVAPVLTYFDIEPPIVTEVQFDRAVVERDSIVNVCFKVEEKSSFCDQDLWLRNGCRRRDWNELRFLSETGFYHTTLVWPKLDSDHRYCADVAMTRGTGEPILPLGKYRLVAARLFDQFGNYASATSGSESFELIDRFAPDHQDSLKDTVRPLQFHIE
jgi:hypothetical protein